MIEKITDALSNEYLKYNDGDWNSAIDRAIEIVQEVAKEYGWIPVESGQLPPNYEDVWVTAVTKNNNRFVTTSFYDKNFEKWRASKDVKVIAWMPKNFPTPYQKGE